MKRLKFLWLWLTGKRYIVNNRNGEIHRLWCKFALEIKDFTAIKPQEVCRYVNRPDVGCYWCNRNISHTAPKGRYEELKIMYV